MLVGTDSVSVGTDSVSVGTDSVTRQRRQCCYSAECAHPQDGHSGYDLYLLVEVTPAVPVPSRKTANSLVPEPTGSEGY